MTTANTPAAAAGLDIAGLETVYDQLATAIDAVGAEKSELFLVKLALLGANRLGDAALFGELIAAAQRDL
ncbi:DUF2783 domain-containing protein [Comamonas aquatilis]|uniref:DUF2783 domain-containing protein n=1 Tax=Comamonas aquatilis TaxID=1778406 RepID=UPI0039F0B29D